MSSVTSLRRAVLTLTLLAAGCTTAPPKPDPKPAEEIRPEPKATTPEMPERPVTPPPEVKKAEEKLPEKKEEEGPKPIDSGIRDDFEKGMKAAIDGDPDK